VKTADSRELRTTSSTTTSPALDPPGVSGPAIALDDRTFTANEGHRYGGTRRRGRVIRRSLVVADLLSISAAFGVTEIIFQGSSVVGRYGVLAEVGLFAASLPGWLVLAKVYGLYDRDEERADHSTADEVFSVFNMLAIGTFGFYAFAYLFPGLTAIPLGKVLTFLAIAIPLVVLSRGVARGICRHTAAYAQNTLIIGAGFVGQRVALKLQHHPEYGVNVVGFVDEHPRERDEELGELTVLGRVAELPGIIREFDVERVIISFSQHPHEKTLELIRDLNDIDVQVDIVPRLFEVIGPHSTIHAAEGLPLIGLAPARLDRSALALKRGMDIVGAVLGLLLLAPLFALAAVAIKLDSDGPVFFRQTRVGRGDREFEILKFRTMSADADRRKDEVVHLNKHLGGDERMFKANNDPRVTRVGGFLRRRSLDEFPQLINVLRSEMSLVGPRPLIPEEHHHVDGWARRRLDLKPGMTGLWQVLGRDDIPFGEMVGLDYRYVTTWSLARDVKLMLMTFALLARSSA
jgi:exopolysaccharide biosynthesis polyprenyl glycosylphosphotransferase